MHEMSFGDAVMNDTFKHPYSKSRPNILRAKKAFGEVHRKEVFWFVGFSPLKAFATRFVHTGTSLLRINALTGDVF
jgi:hypothetical protein